MQQENLQRDKEVDFRKFKVKEAPADAYYIPNFITAAEEDDLWHQIYQAPKPKWTQLSNRRLQNWGGLPHLKGMIPDKIPTWLDKYLVKLHQMEVFEDKRPNHVLVNEYLPGQGIMAHLDGPLFYPTIATINLGSHTVLDFYSLRDEQEKHEDDHFQDDLESSLKDRYIGSFLLEQRSLVCFKNDLYHVYMHGIEEVCEDDLKERHFFNKHTVELDLTKSPLKRGTRISLTIRNFPKILNVKLKFGIR